VGVTVDPVVPVGAHVLPPGVLLVVHGVVYDDNLTLHQPRQDLQSLHAPSSSPNASSRFAYSNPNVSAAFLTLALPPTRTARTSANPTFLLLPFLLTTPSLLTALTSLSLASSIGPFPHLFSGTTSKNKNFSLIPTSWYYLPKIPITAVI